MRYFILSLLLFFYSNSFAQQNLVPNPSFEDTVYCPSATGEIDACSNWMNFGNSPDYFNSCATNGLNVPNSVFGYQNAHNGGAIGGIITWAIPGSAGGGPNYREFIGAQLKSSLVIGTKYYVSFYANFTNILNVAIASNKIGLRFSTVAFDSCCPPALNNFAVLYTDSILSDSINWIKLSNSFIADSAYQYVIIGNFFDDAHTDTINYSSSPVVAHYYIDDACVSTDSLYNEVWTGILQTNPFENKITISPNPADDIIKVQLKNQVNKFEIIITDLFGNRILQKVYFHESKEILLNTSEFANGLYIIALDFGNNFIQYSKILVHH